MGTHKPITESAGDRKRDWLARSWLAVGLTVSAILFVRAMPHSPLRGSRPQARPAAAVATTSTSAQGAPASVGVPSGRTETVYVRRLITQPIETIRVGQRVLGTNPNRDEVEPFEEPDPKTWRTLEVEQIKPNGKKLYATLLRPLDWIEEELDPETNTIELDLPELGAEGTARVLRIGPCPPIASGNGHLVTATFKHEPDGELLTVTVGNDEIGCTANHPFWSEDRQEFIEAGQLRQGERVRTRLEQVAAVVAIKPRPPTAWVYNLEVQGEHVYEVGQSGTLVHNHCAWLTILRNGKVWKGIENVIFTSGGIGGKLSWAQQRAADTEAKIVRKFLGLVKEGDHLIIRGQLPACNHCQRRMKELVAATGAKVSYLWKDGRANASNQQTKDLANGQEIHHSTLPACVCL